jgi:hypothetical protein
VFSNRRVPSSQPKQSQKSHSISITSQTFVDLERKTATALDTRKAEAKSLNNACDLVPDRQTYYLQDAVDYYVDKARA